MKWNFKELRSKSLGRASPSIRNGTSTSVPSFAFAHSSSFMTGVAVAAAFAFTAGDAGSAGLPHDDLVRAASVRMPGMDPVTAVHLETIFRDYGADFRILAKK